MRPERFHRLREVLTRRQPDLTVLMERVHKSHNFSAILRSCDAAGVLEAHAVAADGGLPIHHGTSAGTNKWMRVRLHDDVQEGVAHLRGRGFTLLAAHLSGDAVDYRDVDLTRPTAFLVGAELHGVSEEALALTDEHVVIPMLGMVHSLNVSVATALLLYEAMRQRQDASMYETSRLDPDEFRRTLFEWAHPKLAAVYRRKGRPYPELGPDGEVLEDGDAEARAPS